MSTVYMTHYFYVEISWGELQKSGRGGKAVVGDNEKVESMKPQDRLITVKFNADRSAQMQWDFKPQQREIQVKLICYR